MKVLKSSTISPFGGINFILEELKKLKVDQLLKDNLPKLCSQSRYSWKDIFYTYWSIILCGGECAEDIDINMRAFFANNPYFNLPSPDRLLDRVKQLSVPSDFLKKNRSDVVNEFSINQSMNSLNLKLLKSTKLLPKNNITLDYDNTFIYTKKSDARNTYTKNYGYCPGVGIIEDKIVYVENRNGNCAPHTMQDDTLERMFSQLKDAGIKVNSFRADSASYQFSTICTVHKHTDKFYIKAKISDTIDHAVKSVKEWREVQFDGNSVWRGSTNFIPFVQIAGKKKMTEEIRSYRIVITKEPRKDGQINLFTGEACNYSCIVTNDYDKTDDEVVFFYNQRGKQEKEFDILKNDFAWNKMPFSKIEQNTVFLIMMAMCRNIYKYIITLFSGKVKGISPEFRLKKFIFRFISIPARWVKTGRLRALRLYGNINFET